MYYLILIIIIFALGYSKKIEVTYTNIHTDKINGEVKIALIADLHSCFYGENMEELLTPLLNEEVDFILNVGDMYDGRVTPINSTKYFKGIMDIPSFYTSGNHETYRRRDKKIKKEIRKLNTTVLEGEQRRINIRGNIINICGIDDKNIGDNEFEKQFYNALKNKDENFTILMYHRPHEIKLFKESEVDLVVSGHAHGGQWRIPLLNIGIFAPGQYFFARYINGLYKLNDKTKLFVTRGLARESVKVPRLYNRPEISIIKLKGID